MKKIVVAMMFICLLFPVATYANNVSPNVKDCMEQNGDCEELQSPTSIEIDGSNDMLLQDSEQRSPSFFMNIIKMIFALFLILALLYIILLFLKRKNYTNVQHGNIQNIGGLVLSTNKSVQLIKIGEKVYMLGVGDNVQLLEEITDEHTIQQLEKTAEEKMDPSNYIPSFLKKDKEKDESNMAATFKEELMNWSKNRQDLFKKKVKDERDE
ncbi:flagellar biosynthetic protein FliO [Pseudogracilibacillus sp. ICA-222130]|uniref:flagellar biosynthetic protein FliO n=1 Tax=Pseudogracilibacillus sp. ICA-222130 TaxID=3134655 RepID=UPI0030C447B7